MTTFTNKKEFANQIQTLLVARDWEGAYILAMLSTVASAFVGRRIKEALMLVDEHTFTIATLEKVLNSSREDWEYFGDDVADDTLVTFVWDAEQGAYSLERKGRPFMEGLFAPHHLVNA